MKKPIGKILWRGLGPLLIAVILVAALMLVPFKFGRSSQATIRQAASSMSANVLKGENIKNEAMAENYVPFIGVIRAVADGCLSSFCPGTKVSSQLSAILDGDGWHAGSHALLVDQCVTTCEWEKGSHGVVTAMVRSWRGSQGAV